MNTQINDINFNMWKPLEEFAEEKIKKISELEPLSITLNLKDENTPNKIDKKAELIVKIKGTELFAESVSENFEKSIKSVITKMRKQMLKHKVTPKKIKN